MKKNLTVGMPLAVPTQKRPPSKYASHPYPVLITEVMSTSSKMSGSGYIIAMPIDYLRISYSLIGEGSFKSLLNDYAVDVEILSVNHSILGTGTLKVEVKKDILYKLDDEYINLNMRMLGKGVVRSILIKHDMKEENMKMAASINGTGDLK